MKDWQLHFYGNCLFREFHEQTVYFQQSSRGPARLISGTCRGRLRAAQGACRRGPAQSLVENALSLRSYDFASILHIQKLSPGKLVQPQCPWPSPTCRRGTSRRASWFCGSPPVERSPPDWEYIQKIKKEKQNFEHGSSTLPPLSHGRISDMWEYSPLWGLAYGQELGRSSRNALGADPEVNNHGQWLLDSTRVA